MSERAERRRSDRGLTRRPLVLLDDRGAALDDRALVHDLSEHGFRAETQAELAPEQAVGFRLDLGRGAELLGRARVVWSRGTDLSNWVGAEFVGMRRDDRRRVRNALRPSSTDWNAITDHAIIALSLMLGVLLVDTVLGNPVWRGAVAGQSPLLLAFVLAAWSLRVLLRPGA